MISEMATREGWDAGEDGYATERIVTQSRGGPTFGISRVV